MNRHIDGIGVLIFHQQIFALAGMHRALAQTHEAAYAVINMHDMYADLPIGVRGIRGPAGARAFGFASTPRLRARPAKNLRISDEMQGAILALERPALSRRPANEAQRTGRRRIENRVLRRNLGGGVLLVPKILQPFHLFGDDHGAVAAMAQLPHAIQHHAKLPAKTLAGVKHARRFANR